MKRKGYLTEKIASLDNLYEAFRKASKGKQRKDEVKRFREDFDRNIQSLREQILTGDVKVGNFHSFIIREPKERRIMAAAFCERVLHHAIINVCHDTFDSTLIDTTYATRRGKGVYAAMEKAIEGLAKYDFTVKLDIRKYYDSIDHGVLKLMLRRKFKDPTLLRILDKIIDSYHTDAGKGLPIGNLTSQYFANYYLSSLDHYIKEELRVPIYIRYMDDMLLVGDSVEFLRNAVRELTRFINERLLVHLKPPIYRSSKCGQSFLGYKVKPYRYELAGRSKRRYRSKLTLYSHLLDKGKWGETTYKEHIVPLAAFVMHSVSHNFRADCLGNISNG